MDEPNTVRSQAKWTLAALLAAALAACGSREAARPAEPSPPPLAADETERRDDEPTPRAEPSPPAEPPEEPARQLDEAALRATIARALAEGVAAAHLEGCQLGADDLPPDGAARLERCRVAILRSQEVLRVRVYPRSADGAPRMFEATVVVATLEVARLSIGASTWGVGGGGRVLAGGLEERVSHTHGGAPATISHATIVVHNLGDAPVRVRATRVSWRVSVGCEPPADERAAPRVRGLTAGDGPERAEVEIPPGVTELRVAFAPQDAYYTYCDRFAAHVTLDVGGAPLRVAAEWGVIRREPLHR